MYVAACYDLEVGSLARIDSLRVTSQPKVKVRYEFTLDLIHSRMATVGYELYDVKLPAHIASFEVRRKRKFMMNAYGGNTPGIWQYNQRLYVRLYCQIPGV